MNPLIPPEFFTQSDSSSSQWFLPPSSSNPPLFSYPPPRPASWNAKRVLPFQVQLVQQIIDHPDLLVDSFIPQDINDWLLYYLEGTGKLNERIIASVARNASSLDLSFLPNFQSSAWLPQLSSLDQLRYALDSMIAL